MTKTPAEILKETVNLARDFAWSYSKELAQDIFEETRGSSFASFVRYRNETIEFSQVAIETVAAEVYKLGSPSRSEYRNVLEMLERDIDIWLADFANDLPVNEEEEEEED